MHSLPSSIDAVWDRLQIMTNGKSKFVLINNKQNKIVFFNCDSNLKTLCSSRYVHVGGTVSYRAKFFNQLFVLHASGYAMVIT